MCRPIAKHQVLVDMCLKLAETLDRSEVFIRLKDIGEEVAELEYHDNK